MIKLLRIEEILKERKQTQQWLADQVGTTRNSINSIATAKTWPRPELLLAISKALDVDIRELFHSTKEAQEVRKKLLVDNGDGTTTHIGEIKI